ncbi:metallophosphoesterase [Methylobacterium thuringiense]|uniref:Metallophosphoesterase n=1 Tax=Methylobacterium thuringiense TaxID=1003091 RepID=A0ABQ4TJB1_9HYPH|nr:metallophosphoesterase [Methylobacterium thuringiense]GJE54882.1 hypothetical protein EKPJFOCH_1367 [Methylobacterium thuringiense]
MMNVAVPVHPADPLPSMHGHRCPGLRILLLSDLRIDRSPFELPEALPGFDVLVAAGNLSNSLHRSLLWLADALGERRAGRPVVLVPGNAEFWDGVPRGEALDRGRSLAAELGITLLSDAAVRFEDAAGVGVHLIGATLWTDWSLHGRKRASLARGYARHGHHDCRRINLSRARHLPHDAAGSHARSRAFIEDCLASVKVAAEGFGLSPVALVGDVRPGDRAAVVTHHAPSRRSVLTGPGAEAYEEWISAAQASDLEDVMTAWSGPTLWAHGHVADPVDYRIGRTRVVANPRDRPRRASTFDPALIVEA